MLLPKATGLGFQIVQIELKAVLIDFFGECGAKHKIEHQHFPTLLYGMCIYLYTQYRETSTFIYSFAPGVCFFNIPFIFALF